MNLSSYLKLFSKLSLVVFLANPFRPLFGAPDRLDRVENSQVYELHQASGYLESYSKRKCPKGLVYADQMIAQVLQKTKLGQETTNLSSDIHQLVEMRRQAPRIPVDEISELRQHIKSQIKAAPLEDSAEKAWDMKTQNCEPPPAAALAAPAKTGLELNPSF